MSFLVNQLNARRLEIATQLVPNAQVVGFMVRTSNPTSASDTQEVEAAATTLGIKLLTFKVESPGMSAAHSKQPPKSVLALS